MLTTIIQKLESSLFDS